ncbi:histidine kinase dimerization/phospho-acceptor domain-containing protein [Peribacillus frigoritolerans]|nr:histidine kinase dimerization/phospho-acceptor domain-containing protein [Peribacillus frigoritolerans]
MKRVRKYWRFRSANCFLYLLRGSSKKIPENAPVLNAHIENVYKQEVYSSIIPITFEDGRVKHIEFLTRKNLYSNLNLSIFRDVSKNLEMQEQIRKSDTLNVVGELAAGIAHEIRNPMTALKGFIQLLEDGVKGEFSTYFHVITSEIKRIETIITEFLVLAKPQALKIFKQDVHTILKETLRITGRSGTVGKYSIRDKL